MASSSRANFDDQNNQYVPIIEEIDIDDQMDILFGPNAFDGIEENDPNLGSNKRTRKAEKPKKSPVWEHMDKIPDGVDANGTPKFRAKCKHCQKSFVLDKTGGLGSLRKHLQNVHGLLKDTPAVGDAMLQTQLGFDAQGNVVTFVYDENRAIKALSHYIMATEKPLNMTDDVEWDTLVQTAFCPSYKHISRHTIRKNVMEIYSERKAEIMQTFLNSNFIVACTSDMWSGRNNKGYICVTAHYIDTNWTLQKRVIAFQEVAYPHNGVNIGEAIIDIVEEWGIDQRITSITFDNASACDSAIDHIRTLIQTPFREEIEHVRCVCHIINLIVQVGLKKLEEYISPIRDAILFIASSNKRQKLFGDYCAKIGKKKRRFGGDCRTRWNSTYLMLKSVEGYETTITRFLNENGNPGSVSQNDWNAASVLREFLEPFYDATNILSGVYYPTTNNVIPQLLFLTSAFQQYRGNEILYEAINDMEDKFLKYFETIPMIFCLSSILDPRQKDASVGFMLNQIPENMTTPYRPVVISPTIEQVKQELNVMYDKYLAKFGVSGGSQKSSSDPKGKGKGKSKYAIGSLFKTTQATPTGTSCVSELTLFLNQHYFINVSERDIENFDILDWWKNYERTYPIVSKMARDLLTPPASTVPSESTFSAGKRVLSEKRSCLTSEILEVLICSKDWSDANKRTQDQHPLDVLVTELYQDLGIDPDTPLDVDELPKTRR